MQMLKSSLLIFFDDRHVEVQLRKKQCLSKMITKWNTTYHQTEFNY